MNVQLLNAIREVHADPDRRLAAAWIEVEGDAGYFFRHDFCLPAVPRTQLPASDNAADLGYYNWRDLTVPASVSTSRVRLFLETVGGSQSPANGWVIDIPYPAIESIQVIVSDRMADASDATYAAIALIHLGNGTFVASREDLT